MNYPTLPKGASQQLQLLGTYADGTIQDLSSLATWSSNDSTIFEVESTGLTYGVQPGTTQILGSALGKSALITMTCQAATLRSLDVLQPLPPTFALGTTMDFVAVGSFSNGDHLDVSTAAIWSSSDPNILTIDGTGRAKSGKVGTTTVSATLLGVVAFSVNITVTDATLAQLSLPQFVSDCGFHQTAVQCSRDPFGRNVPGCHSRRCLGHFRQ